MSFGDSRKQPSGAVSAALPLALFAVRLLACVALLVWSQWPSLVRMQQVWHTQPQYSHGYFVPLFAAYILWVRRGCLLDDEPVPSMWGLFALLLGVGLRWWGTAYFVDFIDDFSLIPTLLGVMLISGGFAALNWSYPAVLFLGLMLPLPYRWETGIQQQLLQFATWAGTYGLQTLGIPAYAEGNVIQLPQSRLGLLDACSGLRMSIVCSAAAALVAIVSTAPLAQRVILFLSGAPLALVVNILRICTMGVLSEKIGQETTERLFHDVSGYAMMIVAVILLATENSVLNWVFERVDEFDRRPMFVGNSVAASKERSPAGV